MREKSHTRRKFDAGRGDGKVVWARPQEFAIREAYGVYLDEVLSC